MTTPINGGYRADAVYCTQEAVDGRTDVVPNVLSPRDLVSRQHRRNCTTHTHTVPIVMS